MAKLALAISLIQCTKCDRSETDDTADLTRSKKKGPPYPLLQCSGDNVGDQKAAVAESELVSCVMRGVRVTPIAFVFMPKWRRPKDGDRQVPPYLREELFL